jgi:hypothetical protein
MLEYKNTDLKVIGYNVWEVPLAEKMCRAEYKLACRYWPWNLGWEGLSVTTHNPRPTQPNCISKSQTRTIKSWLQHDMTSCYIVSCRIPCSWWDDTRWKSLRDLERSLCSGWEDWNPGGEKRLLWFEWKRRWSTSREAILSRWLGIVISEIRKSCA